MCLCVSVRLKSKKMGCYQGVEPVFISCCYDTLIPPAPLPPDVLYHLADWLVYNQPGLYCLCSCPSVFTDPTQFQLASLLCDQSLSNLHACRSQSLLFSVNPSEPCTSMIHHLGVEGARLPRLIVLYQDLISPTLLLASGTKLHSV